MSRRTAYALTVSAEQACARRTSPPVDWARITPHPELEQLEEPCAACGADLGDHLVEEPQSCPHTQCMGFRPYTFESVRLALLDHDSAADRRLVVLGAR